LLSIFFISTFFRPVPHLLVVFTNSVSCMMVSKKKGQEKTQRKREIPVNWYVIFVSEKR
jgi:hypothetical protein